MSVSGHGAGAEAGSGVRYRSRQPEPGAETASGTGLPLRIQGQAQRQHQKQSQNQQQSQLQCAVHQFLSGTHDRAGSGTGLRHRFLLPLLLLFLLLLPTLLPPLYLSLFRIRMSPPPRTRQPQISWSRIRASRSRQPSPGRRAMTGSRSTAAISGTASTIPAKRRSISSRASRSAA